jgi:hypothetical protein
LEYDGVLYALAAFYDYPNIHDVPSNDWEEKWWKTSYGQTAETSKFNAINTLFLHLFVAQPDFSERCAEELIKVTYKTLPEIDQILLCVPQQMATGSFSILLFALKLSHYPLLLVYRICSKKIFRTH